MLRALQITIVVLLSLAQCQRTVSAAEVPSRRVEWPCTDRSAIQWVRNPKDCAGYFICHFGQPLSMPACPYGQVWGNKARNCVPVNSRWNDCEEAKYVVNNKTGSEDKKQEFVPISLATSPATVIVTIKPIMTETPFLEDSFAPLYPFTSAPKTDRTFSATKPPEKSQRVTILRKKTKRPIPTPAPRQDDGARKTKQPTAISPFHPKAPKRYYTYHPRHPTYTLKPVVVTEAPRTSWETKEIQPTKPQTRPIQPPMPEKPPVKQEKPSSKPENQEKPLYSPVRPIKPPTKVTKPPTKQVKPQKKPEKQQTKPVKPTQPVTQRVKPVKPPMQWPAKVPTTPAAPQTSTTTWRTVMPTQKARLATTETPAATTATTPTTTSRPTTTTPRLTTTTTTTTTTQRPTTTTTLTTSRTNTTARPTTEEPKTRWVDERQMVSPFTTPTPSDWAIKPMQLRLPEDHPCRTRPGKLVAHSAQCHWYYNCTVAAMENIGAHLSVLEEECRYPQLFDTVTGRCREFINVRCEDRFEPVDPCEYQALQCRSANCVPCQHRYGSCRGQANGIYPFHTERWTPTFITCYQERNIAQDDCQGPTPIFSPVERDCVALFDVPKEKGGLLPDCSFREDGFYPDEQGRCGIFFECRDGEFSGYDECPSGTVFDPLTLRCQQLDRASPPCGEGQNPSCTDRHDGFHADPFGRCPYYFECRKNQFVRHLTCDFGAFDAASQTCVIPSELMPRPCGLLPNPCEGKPSGFYPDEGSDCRHYVECSRGVMISNGTCPEGSVFSSISGRCDRPENAPQPCGLAPSCEDRKDGKYSALTRGCSFYFECSSGRFTGLKQCSFEDGGFFFNEQTGRCDFPQNICPPCGYRWWGCSGSTHR